MKSLIGMTVCGFFPLNIWEVLKMSDRMRNILETCVKIDYFGEANPQLKTEVPYSVELFLANQNNIDRLNQAGITLVAAKGAGLIGTRNKEARIFDIIGDVRMVAKNSRLIETKAPTFQILLSSTAAV